ncbi:hypothetical protein HYPSUDRAFT_1034945 [Hypholoma sublateritium FD-334 SS-4]|uniref:Uncharacterized protein n=1 Tax=Hypholoma sublateritium (strain FD-334 SS-4) TaxID=945553 RepID=A0A0D2Q5N7_HYPSF|nr:hypothetical protein HYPSUDRAFT_1034945 [Hypholoma sublateritium FD-334 SS-4]
MSEDAVGPVRDRKVLNNNKRKEAQYLIIRATKSVTQRGFPVAIDPKEEEDYEESYARVYYCKLPSRTVIGRLVAPVRPFFKTEADRAVWDRKWCMRPSTAYWLVEHISIPVPPFGILE